MGLLLILPSKFKGPAFHCPEYVKKILISKYLAYEKLLNLSQITLRQMLI